MKSFMTRPIDVVKDQKDDLIPNFSSLERSQIWCFLETSSQPLVPDWRLLSKSAPVPDEIKIATDLTATLGTSSPKRTAYGSTRHSKACVYNTATGVNA